MKLLKMVVLVSAFVHVTMVLSIEGEQYNYAYSRACILLLELKVSSV